MEKRVTADPDDPTVLSQSTNGKTDKIKNLPIGRLKEEAGVIYFFAYFFLNRSTRPSVSMIFCVPVKKGWQ